MRLRILLLLFAVFTPVLADAVAADERLALVIGNSQYAFTQRLQNPENDARLMASVLRTQGFEVLEHQNLGFKDMKRAVKAYTARLGELGQDATGLIYYAGHGLQSEGNNYLVPVDAQIDKEGDIEIETISSQALLSGLQHAGNRLNIIILDACRNNPYRGQFRSGARGLARMDAPVGSFVAFSTAPGKVAADGVDANSPYTSALANAMSVPGLKIEEVFKRVRNEVYAATDGKQVPWESSSIFGDFYFAGSADAGTPVAAAPAAPADVTAPPSVTHASRPEASGEDCVRDGAMTYCASSTLPPFKSNSYRVANILDGRGSTAWVEGESGDGIGEWILVEFDRIREPRSLTIRNGYAKNEDIFSKNNRIREIEIRLSNGRSLHRVLEDTDRSQTIDLRDAGEAAWMQIRILSVYRGWKYRDTALSELQVSVI